MLRFEATIANGRIFILLKNPLPVRNPGRNSPLTGRFSFVQLILRNHTDTCLIKIS